uniref:Uncharacterized protein n=1 Tax=Brassica oleracea TaxID=3712 RepID=A0A3P6DI84_BRAOL|nr:unnamed protein product [Brassica oleracea]
MSLLLTLRMSIPHQLQLLTILILLSLLLLQAWRYLFLTLSSLIQLIQTRIIFIHSRQSRYLRTCVCLQQLFAPMTLWSLRSWSLLKSYHQSPLLLLTQFLRSKGMVVEQLSLTLTLTNLLYCSVRRKKKIHQIWKKIRIRWIS